MTQAFIGLGSNLDAPGEQLRQALQAMAALPGTQLLATSAFYSSESLLAGQPRYTNAVAALQTELPPLDLLDALHANLRLKNDAALARILEVNPPIISKIRHRRLSVGGALLIRIHEVTGLNISDLRFLMGDRRQKYRISDMQGKAMADRMSKVVWPAAAG